MINTIKILIAALLLSVLVAGCTTIQPATTNMVDITGTDFTQEMKVGQACENYFLFFGPFGTRDIGDAAKKADIKEIKLVEYSSQFYFLVARNCVKLRGF